MTTLNLRRRWTTAWLKAVALSPDGSLVASAHGKPVAEPGDAVLWEAATGKERCRLPLYPYPVWSVAFSPDGTLLAYGGGGGSIVFWDVERSRVKKELKGCGDGITFLTFSPDSTLIATTARTK